VTLNSSSRRRNSSIQSRKQN